MTAGGLLGCVLAILVVLAVPVPAAHYVPAAGTGFSYDETISLSAGTGNYTGYTESTVVNGSITVTGVLPNGTDAALYYNADHYQNNQGESQSWTSSGPFAFSPQTFSYTNGTDNQTGYVNPKVWFYIDATLPVGSTVYLLDSQLQVVSTSMNYDLGTAAGGWVKAIFLEGNGSYQRNDAYGVFTATYNWKAYFDPTTGFIIGYLYTEVDSNAAGPGFTITDSLAVTHTSYTLTAGTATSSSSSSGSSSLPWAIIAVGIVVAIVVIVVVVVLAVRASRRRHPMPRHSPTGQVSYAPPPPGPAPPPITLTPSGQPAVQQIIIKETVKVNCRYCGGLIDTTAEKCPFCGATRS